MKIIALAVLLAPAIALAQAVVLAKYVAEKDERRSENP